MSKMSIRQVGTIRQIATILIATICLTFCSKTHARAFYLNKAEPAPFAGYLLDGASEIKARTAIQQNDTYKEIVENQYGMINNLHQQNLNLDSKILILSNNQESTLTGVLYFVGGMLVGGLVVHKIKN